MSENETTKNALQSRCSVSCVRAGYFALVLSALGISLLQPLESVDALDNLVKYTFLRGNLTKKLEDLKASDCWSRLVKHEKEQNHEAEALTLRQLLDVVCLYPQDQSSPEVSVHMHASDLPEPPDRMQVMHPQIQVLKKAQEQTTGENAADTGDDYEFRLKMPLIDVRDIVEILVQLGNENLLKKGMQYSFASAYSIYEWAKRWHEIESQYLARSGKGRTVVTVRNPTQDPHQVFEVFGFKRERILSHFALKDIQKLASVAPPALGDVQAEVEKRRVVNLASFPLPLGFVVITTLLEASLFLAVIYFWLFQREFRRIANTPTRGTIFSVFQQSYSTRLLFKGIVCIPSVSAMLLAIRSLSAVRWIDWGLAILVVIFCGLVAKEFTALENSLAGRGTQALPLRRRDSQ